MEMTLVVSRFHFLRVGSRTSELCAIILPGMQILIVGSLISDCSWFRFLFLKLLVVLTDLERLGPKRWRRYEQKLNENDQYGRQSRENESCFHYLCTKEVDRYKENEKTQIQSQIYVYKNNLIT